MKRHSRQSLGGRIFKRMLVLILAIAVLTYLLINLLLGIYIKTNVSSKLDSMVGGLVTSGSGGQPDLSEEELRGLGMKGDAFLLSADGAVTKVLQGDPVVVDEMAVKMREKGLVHANTRSAYVATKRGEFYISCVADKLHPEAFMAFYVDVTTVMRFYRSVIVALLAVLSIAGIIAIFGARGFSKNVQSGMKQLTDYAARIGSRDFQAICPAFEEREMDALAGAMARMAGELLEAQELQTTFFQNISHELRTPLMSIRCYAEGIACGVMDAKESGETILEETDRLTGMVEDLLYISRMEQGATERLMETVDLRDILSECVSALRRQAQRRQIRFDFQFTEEPVWFTCDQHEIAQMYTNLLTNALRYARTMITLECRTEHSEILLAVNDDGEGLSDTDLTHVFERFYKGRGGQHGIGLSIVQSIVEFYGGSIVVKNCGGARFEIRIPRR